VPEDAQDLAASESAQYDHAGMVPRTERFFQVVTVGTGTYGSINAVYSGGASERLTIGHYCSIGSDTEFILGSEHPYRYASTISLQG